MNRNRGVHKDIQFNRNQLLNDGKYIKTKKLPNGDWQIDNTISAGDYTNISSDGTISTTLTGLTYITTLNSTPVHVQYDTDGNVMVESTFQLVHENKVINEQHTTLKYQKDTIIYFDKNSNSYVYPPNTQPQTSSRYLYVGECFEYNEDEKTTAKIYLHGLGNFPDISGGSGEAPEFKGENGAIVNGGIISAPSLFCFIGADNARVIDDGDGNKIVKLYNPKILKDNTRTMLANVTGELDVPYANSSYLVYNTTSGQITATTSVPQNVTTSFICGWSGIIEDEPVIVINGMKPFNLIKEDESDQVESAWLRPPIGNTVTTSEDADNFYINGVYGAQIFSYETNMLLKTYGDQTIDVAKPSGYAPQIAYYDKTQDKIITTTVIQVDNKRYWLMGQFYYLNNKWQFFLNRLGNVSVGDKRSYYVTPTGNISYDYDGDTQTITLTGLLNASIDNGYSVVGKSSVDITFATLTEDVYYMYFVTENEDPNLVNSFVISDEILNSSNLYVGKVYKNGGGYALYINGLGVVSGGYKTAYIVPQNADTLRIIDSTQTVVIDGLANANIYDSDNNLLYTNTSPSMTLSKGTTYSTRYLYYSKKDMGIIPHTSKFNSNDNYYRIGSFFYFDGYWNVFLHNLGRLFKIPEVTQEVYQQNYDSNYFYVMPRTQKVVTNEAGHTVLTLTLDVHTGTQLLRSYTNVELELAKTGLVCANQRYNDFDVVEPGDSVDGLWVIGQITWQDNKYCLNLNGCKTIEG